MRILQKTAACLTLSCLLIPASPVWAAEEALPYHSQIIINDTLYSPIAQPLAIGEQIYLPLRWTFNTLGINDVTWTPSETAAYQAVITLSAPSYFLLQQYQSLLKGLTVDGNDLQHTLPPQLYRITLPPSPLLEETSLRRTPRALALDITDGDYTYRLDVYDYLLVDGQYYLPSYWFNRITGAEMSEDMAKDALALTAFPTEHWQKALDTLSQQLACSEPSEVMALWFMALEKQSGGLQYALFAQNLRSQAYKQAAASGTWHTANGDATFGQATITDEKTLSSTKHLYTIQFSELLAQKPNKTLHQQITVEKINGAWQITAITGDTAYYTLLP